MSPRFFRSAARRAVGWPAAHWRGLVLLLVAAVAAHVAITGVMQRKLERQQAELAAAGEKTSLAQFALNLPEAENAATLYNQALEKIDSPVDPRGKAEDLGMRDIRSSHPVCGVPVETPGRTDEEDATPLSKEEEALLLEFIQRNEPVYALLREAATRPNCQFGRYDAIGDSAPQMLPELSIMRSLARMCAIRALREARQGNPGQACQWLAETVRLANRLQNDPLLIAGLVRSAIMGIANETAWSLVCLGAIPDPLPPGLFEALDTVARRDLWAKHYEAERCFSNRSFHPGVSLQSLLLGPALELPNQLRINDLMRAVTACVREEDHAARQARMEWINTVYPHKKPQYWRPWRLMSDMLGPAMIRSMSAMERALAQTAATRVLLLLGRYHTAHGVYPATLDELAADHGAPLPLDPFSGKPLVYRQEGRGFTLYSLGEDGQDNGGQPSVKRGPGDLVWCVPSE